MITPIGLKESTRKVSTAKMAIKRSLVRYVKIVE
jgi:hypothetical protein